MTRQSHTSRLLVDDEPLYLSRLGVPGGAAQLSQQGAVKAVKEVFFAGCEYNNNNGNYRTRTVATTGSQRFTFSIPFDFLSLVALTLVGQVSAGAAGADRNIDFFSEYHATGEPTNQHAQSDTTGLYDLSNYSGKTIELNLAALFSSVAAGDYCGLLVTHNNIGGNMDYVGIRLKYNA